MEQISVEERPDKKRSRGDDMGLGRGRVTLVASGQSLSRTRELDREPPPRRPHADRTDARIIDVPSRIRTPARFWILIFSPSWEYNYFLSLHSR